MYNDDESAREFLTRYAWSLQIALSVFYHFVFYKLSVTYMRKIHPNTPKGKPHYHHQTASRVVSCIHATVATVVSIYILLNDDGFHENPLRYSSMRIEWIMNNTIGYFIYDFIYMVCHREELTLEYAIHHLASAVAFSQCVFGSVFLVQCLLRLASEASTPCLNIRWMFLSLKMKYTKWYMLNATVLLIIFVGCRLVPIGPNWYLLYRCSQMAEWPLLETHQKVTILLASVSIDALNLNWSYTLFKKAFRFVWKKEYLLLKEFGGDGGLAHYNEKEKLLKNN